MAENLKEFFQGRQCNILSSPLEIKLEVISYLKLEDILRLSDTCHVMRDALFSTAFRRAIIRPIISYEVMSKAQSSTTRNTLYRTLNWDGYVPETTLPAILDALLAAYSNSLPKMRNVTSLTLLSHLKSLALHSCDFGRVKAKPVRDVLVALKLEKFELLEVYWAETSNKDTPEIRAAFSSLMENLVELKSNQPWLRTVLSSSSSTPPPQIVNLHLGLFNTRLREIISFILRFPTLESITIDEDTLDHEPIYLHPVTEQISLSSLPRLRQLTCPLRFISALVGPHNISQLFYYGPSRGLQIAK
ncbi:hypothetical protein GYMLUDRAFT_86150 [Collybiopsis luxurians FD-317 M1]|uniref:F-box domain-containing protein n=1 Tax=Collybiopsis luxurians FD-317 M1 TaxID=944289 RepID=A0A0D0C8D2_9AGAR|nr:hypothetical protein GYMLUDRAFT_86150 [Collybiopsis luxurians FD-317 M1]